MSLRVLMRSTEVLPRPHAVKSLWGNGTWVAAFLGISA